MRETIHNGTGIELRLSISLFFLVFSGMIFSCDPSYTNTQPTKMTSVSNEKSPTDLSKNTSSEPLSFPVKPEKINLTFSSDPPEVEVYLDGVFSGVTPTIIPVPLKNKRVEVIFKKEGFRDAKQTIELIGDVPVIAKLTPIQGQPKK